MFNITSVTRDNKAITFDRAKTYIDNRGFIYAGDDLQTDDVINIEAKSVYINPSGTTNVYTATATITVDGSANSIGKYCAVEAMPFISYVDGTLEATASE